MSFDAECDEAPMEIASTHVGRVGADWREADRQLRRIAKRRAGLDADEATWLVRADRSEAHVHVGCATFAEYVERVLGYGPRVCADRMRVAYALEELPIVRRALAGGAIAYSAVRELARVATPDTEHAWLDRARDKTVREIEELVAGHRRGDLPDDPPEADLRLRTIRFEVTPETLALYREAERALATHVGHDMTDDAALAAMCRAVLAPATPAESNAPPFQIALTICAQCDRATQDGAGRAIDVSPSTVARARCDAQVLGRVDGDARERATRTIPPALRTRVLRRDHHRCVVPGCRATRHIEVHHIQPRAQGGRHHADNLVCLCDGHHTALHRGKLAITGTPKDRTFWNADGSRWGSRPAWVEPPPPPSAPTPRADDARSALRNLGYRSHEAAAAVADALTHVSATAPLDELILAALRAARNPAAG